jgi:hypothetical protein
LDTKKDFYFNESLGKSEVRVWGNSATSTNVSRGDEEDDSEIDDEVWDTIGKLGRTGYAEERETSARFLGVESDGIDEEGIDPLDKIFPIISDKKRFDEFENVMKSASLARPKSDTMEDYDLLDKIAKNLQDSIEMKKRANEANENTKYRYEDSGAIESCECASCVQRRRMHLVDKQWEQRSSDRL